jgi:ankyrin repeat protein
MMTKQLVSLTLLSVVMFFYGQGGQRPPEILQAAQDGDVDAVKSLLMDEPTLVHVQDDFGATALHWAAIYGRREVVAELLKYKPDVNLEERHGGTAMHWAAHFDDPDVVASLIEHGAEIDHRNQMGRTPLHVAARRGNLEVAKLLLDKGADKDLRVEDGSTVLHIAARNGHPVMLDLLIRAGVDPSVENKAAKTYMDELFVRPDIVRRSPEALAGFAGRYRVKGRRREFDIRWESGHLYFYAFGKDELLPISDRGFITDSERLFFTFTKDSDGIVDGLVFEFPGGQIQAEKIVGEK